METSSISSQFRSDRLIYGVETTLLITGVVLAVLGGLRLAGLMKGINGMRFVQIGAGLSGTAILTMIITAAIITAAKKYAKAPDEGRSPAVPAGNNDSQTGPLLTSPNVAASATSQRASQGEELGPRSTNLRKRNHAMHIPEADFEELVAFLRQHHVFGQAIKDGTLLAQTSLNLNNKGLRTIPDSVYYLKNLKYLYLNDNQLTELPPRIGRLAALQSLELNNNQLTVLPDSIGRLVALRYLELNNNRLTVLPDSIGRLVDLQILHLSYNRLTVLPDSIGRLVDLQILHLSYNRLTVLPDSIGRLVALKELWLKNNQLTALPPSIGHLEALHTLWLNKNRLTECPPSIGLLVALRDLDLSYNRLTELPPSIGLLGALHKLALDHNQLTGLPTEIGRLAALRILYLHDNRLTTLPNSMHNPNLHNLLIMNNPGLTTLPLSLSCTQITYINTDGTSILPETIAPILVASQQARYLQGAQRLPAKLTMWKTIGGITEAWPPLTDDTQMALLYEWLLRLEQTSDFQNHQADMAKITCQILTTVFNDEDFRKQFFDLIASDLTACGDRAAMSLNLVYTEWRLHCLPENSHLSEIIPLLIGYAKTLKLREIIFRDHGEKMESVERFLYAESILREPLQLVTAVQSMLYSQCGRDVDLGRVQAEIQAIPDADYIVPLSWWQNYLQKHYADTIEKQRAVVAEEFEKTLQRRDLSEDQILTISQGYQDKQSQRVYGPITEHLVQQIPVF